MRIAGPGGLSQHEIMQKRKKKTECSNPFKE